MGLDAQKWRRMRKNAPGMRKNAPPPPDMRMGPLGAHGAPPQGAWVPCPPPMGPRCAAGMREAQFTLVSSPQLAASKPGPGPHGLTRGV